MKTLLLLAVLAVAGWMVATRHPAPVRAGPERRPPASLLERAPAETAAPAPAFACDGRTRCTEMTSCAEATYFLQHCPGVTMDGDGDGVPCERQWCGGG